MDSTPQIKSLVLVCLRVRKDSPSWIPSSIIGIPDEENLALSIPETLPLSPLKTSSGKMTRKSEVFLEAQTCFKAGQTVSLFGVQMEVLYSNQIHKSKDQPTKP